MYAKVIVGHDLSQGGEDALALARLIEGATGATLVVAGVFPFGTLPRGYAQASREFEEDPASKIQELAAAVGAEAEAFPSSSPARGLQELAEETGADLIVVGSSRRSRVGEILAGNVGLGLLHGSPCPVALAPRDYRQRNEYLATVTVGFDASPEAKLALDDAIGLAKASEATLKLVAVAQPPTAAYTANGARSFARFISAIEQQRREELQAAVATVPPGIKVEARLVSGDPAAELADAVRADGSLLILGSRGYGPVRRVVLGSASASLMRLASSPVLVHPRGTPVERGAARLAEAGNAQA